MRQQVLRLGDGRILFQIGRAGHQPVAHGHQRPRDQTGRDQARLGDANRQIDPIGHQIHPIVGDRQLHLYLGPTLAIGGDARREPHLAKHRGRADAQQAMGLLAVLAGEGLQLLGLVHQAQTTRVDLCARIGERQRTRGAVQQLDAELMFEPRDAAADR